MPAPSFRTAALAALGLAAVAIGGLTVFVVTAQRPAPADGVAVVLTGRDCQPASLSVPAGRTTFVIRNASDRPQEWEIIQGVMVVEERENIAPGTSQKMTVTLAPGRYDITCSPQAKFQPDLRRTLTVTAAAGPTPGTARPRPVDLIGPLAEYRFFMFEQAAALLDQTRAFTAAIKAGDLAGARALYPAARAPYERIGPVADLFSDLAGAIDSRANDHEQHEADPGFTGFHRLEYGLFALNTTQGLDVVADKLLADVGELQNRVKTLAVPPEKMAGGAATLIESVAATRLSGEEDRYSHTDLWDVKANVEGSAKIVDLLRPLLARADQALLDRIDGRFAAIDRLLAGHARGDGGFAAYDTLTDGDRAALKAPVTALAEDLARLRGALGLN